MNRKNFDIDAITLSLYFMMAFFGWLSIYTVTSGNGALDILDFGREHGKQLIWIGVSAVVGLIVLTLDYRLFETLAYFAYGGAILLLILTLFIGTEVNGAKAWLNIAGQRFQPAEFAKNDTGSALVFGSFLIVFYREGLTPLIPLFLAACLVVVLTTLYLGYSEYSPLWVPGVILVILLLIYAITFSRKYWLRNLIIHTIVFVFFGGLSLSANTIYDKLPDHQQKRISVFFDPGADPTGAGYNVIQSKIAIGSGGIDGKGFLQGNYTKYKFVPKQETDFIFCTVGEEFGWIGSSFVILLFLAMISRMQFMAENGKMRFTRIYGYSVLSIIFFHLIVNVGMTIGLVPVIGIPLPFFSYGGSALLSFTVLIFIMINLYSYRASVLGRES